MASLSTLFASANRGFIKNILVGSGLMLGTAGVSLAIISTMIEHFKSSVYQLPSVLLQMASVTGLHIYFSLVLGAIVTKHFRQSSPLHLMKSK
ncbi:DUF2523 domain-containing protein [Acinetobacter sp. AOR43_HL]|uniref:DUF2523 family protein n=1 Tax=Acinetobacter sp. AOR43_HL TaxID=2919390 RepID=UPI0022EB9D09|nr:DUF2523 family protein [Acinetobacter sp. AOR43_HL]MDA3451970.1 DUF2523 domain-containing protein [Acinetobacter sp. AOR43_HL]MDA3453141.1 DUF2523 domain-containing protein [Acinetobacter sp. AOR43_HL]